MARSKDFDEEEVLSKAVSLFWHKGYNGTSMQELVDALNISRSSLYDTYVDKRTLYLKALEFYRNAGSATIEKLLTSSASAKDTIRKLFEIVASDLVSDNLHKGCFMVNAEVEVAPHDLEVKAIVQKNEEQIESAFLRAVQKGQKSGEITSRQDAKALARFLLNAATGLRVTAKTATDKSIFNDVIETTMSVLG